MIVIILVFLAALLYRAQAMKKQGLPITGFPKKAIRVLTIVLLVFLMGFLFKVMGKIAILVGAIIAVIALLTLKKG